MLLSRMDFSSSWSVTLGRNVFGPGRITASAVACGSPSSSDLRNKPSTTRSELTTTQVSESAACTRARTAPMRSVRPQVGTSASATSPIQISSTTWAPSSSRRLTSVAEKTWDGINLMYSASPYTHWCKPHGEVHQDHFARRFSPNRQLRLVKDLGGIPGRQAIAPERHGALDQIEIPGAFRSESVRDFFAGAQRRDENGSVLVDRDQVVAGSADDLQKGVRPMRL